MRGSEQEALRTYGFLDEAVERSEEGQHAAEVVSIWTFSILLLIIVIVQAKKYYARKSDQDTP